MEKIDNAYFFDKDFRRWDMSTAYVRAFRDSASAVCGDSRAMTPIPLMPFEYGRDKIKVSVYGQNGMVAFCEAFLSHIRPTQADVQSHVSCGLQAALNRASFELRFEQVRTGRDYTHIETPVLVITHLEVQEDYRGKHIGSAILDFLQDTMAPSIVLCAIEPFYKTQFDGGKAMTQNEKNLIRAFFTRNKFERNYTAPIQVGSVDGEIMLCAKWTQKGA